MAVTSQLTIESGTIYALSSLQNHSLAEMTIWRNQAEEIS